MRIIISPAKKMNVDTDSFAVEALPRFVGETEKLMEALKGMTPEALQKLWKCNDGITALNVERLQNMDLRRGLTPAVLSYEGIQYQYLPRGCWRPGDCAICGSIYESCLAFTGCSAPLTG